MRVMFINSVVDYGSTGKIVRELAEGLKEQGHEVLIAYGRHDAKKDEDTFNISNKWSTYYHVLMTRLFGRHGLHSSKETKKLIEKIDEFKPEIIHLHNVHGYYLNVPMLFDHLSKQDIKIYWTLHDAWSFSGSSAYFDYHGCKEWNNGCVVCESFKDYPEVKLFPNQKRNFAWKEKSFTSVKDLTIISPSDWLSDMARTTFLNKYPVLTINNGIDLDTFRVKSTVNYNNEKLDGKFVILGLASVWERRKGLDYFLELSNKLSSDEIIVLVGLEKSQIDNLPHNIVGIERTKNVEELVDIYNRADVFLNPTLEDNFPTTNLESLACGTPVITFDTGGSPEAIDEKTGIVCEEKSLDSILMALQNIRQSSIDFENECSSRAQRLYSKELSSQKYIDLFLKENLNE